MTRKIEVTMTGPDADGFLWLRADGGGLAGMVSLRADSIVGRAFLAAPSSRAPEDAEARGVVPADLRKAIRDALDVMEEQARECEGRVVAADVDEDCDEQTVAVLRRHAARWREPADALRAALDRAKPAAARERTEGEATGSARDDGATKGEG